MTPMNPELRRELTEALAEHLEAPHLRYLPPPEVDWHWVASQAMDFIYGPQAPEAPDPHPGSNPCH